MVENGIYENVFILNTSFHENGEPSNHCYNATNMTWNETQAAYFVNGTQERVDDLLNAKVNQLGYGFSWSNTLQMIPQSSASYHMGSPLMFIASVAVALFAVHCTRNGQ